MRTARRGHAAAVLICSTLSGVAHAETFNVPRGRLGDVAAALGSQANATIAVTDPDLAGRKSPGVRGTMPVRAALDHVLRGTGGEAVFYAPTIIRIIKRRAPPAAASTPPSPPAPDRLEGSGDIIVTASKQDWRLDHYPGSVKLMAMEQGWVARNASGGTAAIAQLLPALAATNLGSGRDKLFIRGIADSSFAGPTQATVGQYLGDVRLTFNAPDPDLNLYDMKQVEVLVGPQGTLYGAGSLGGVLRLVPNVPDMHDIAVSTADGLSFTRHGGPSWDGAGMLNLPLSDKVAFRFVVYGQRKGGYIDDPSRGLSDINSSRSYGGRYALRTEGWSDWTIDLGFVFQNIATADGQYTLRNDPPLTRTSAIAQPFDNDYRLGYITARRPIGQGELVSTTSVARHELTSVFDATGYDGTSTVARYQEKNDITLFSHETRLSGGGETPWVVGLSALFNLSIISRSLGPVSAPQQIPGVANAQNEAALFGQWSRSITSRLTGTVGGRLTYANSIGTLIDGATGTLDTRSRNAFRFSSTLALDWHPGGRWSAFFHYQQGYRPGGLAVAPQQSGVESRKFAADDLNMNELGFRFGDQMRDRLSIRAAIFAAQWDNIQADLVDQAGLPYTTNVGQGRIYGLDGEATWRPIRDVSLSVAAFVNDSKLTRPADGFETSRAQTLPNVSRGGGRFAASWRHSLASGVVLSSNASVRYVGGSRLGVGQLLDIPQGDYYEADVGARIDYRQFSLFLDLDNLTDVRANSFAFGNPFGVAQRDQETPLRPRTVRIGLAAKF
ncbi:MAG TPA: TonB-dependent receptor [Sphingobium sp.]|uniref:TonB-dependent receptor n=1 Tax=Sphingobium sp. TaxID=1912891 RepID=UPI002ED6A16D